LEGGTGARSSLINVESPANVSSLKKSLMLLNN